jgi:hypothetical protein
MEPNDYLNQNNNPGQPYPTQPMQRPAQNSGQRPAPRPMQGFGGPQQRPTQPTQDLRPRPRAPQQVNNYAPQPANPRPANYNQPYIQQQRPFSPQPQQQQPPTPQGPLNFEPPKKKKKILRKIITSTALVLVLGLCSFLFFVAGKSTDDKSKVTAQNNQPSVKPLEKPEFTTYFPSPMPTGIKVAKGSISYYKDSFTYIFEQGGQKTFFVYEQPATTDPDLNTLKSKLAAPKGIALTLGQGIEGSLDNGTVTAVKTDKNTNIIINCIKTVCSTAPRDILSSMQVNDDLETIKKGNQ